MSAVDLAGTLKKGQVHSDSELMLASIVKDVGRTSQKTPAGLI